MTEGSGDTIIDTAGEALGKHKLVYLSASSDWRLADADSVTTMPVIGLTLEAIAAGQKGTILLRGYVADPAWSWSLGGSTGKIYASQTAGELTQTAPLNNAQVVAVARTATGILFSDGLGSVGAIQDPEHTADYIIWVDAGIYYAKNGHTGQVTSNADAATLINGILGTLLQGGKIFVKGGIYFINSTLIINGEGITIEGVNPFWETTNPTIFKLSNNANTNVIQVNGRKTVLCRFTVDGNKSNNLVSGHGIQLTSTSSLDLHIECVYVLYTRERGIVWLGGNGSARHVYVEYTEKEGWYISGSQNTFIDCSAWNCVRYGLSVSPSAEKNTFIGFRSFGNTGAYAGVVFQGTDNSFLDGKVWNNQRQGIYLLGAVRSIVTGNHILNNSVSSAGMYNGVELGDNTIKCIINNNVVSGTHKYSIFESITGTSSNQIQNNFVESALTGQISPSSSKTEGNVGYVTENSCSATIASGATSVVVNHGLSYTPSAANTEISVMYLEVPTNNPGPWSVDTFTATQCTIRVMSDPGASNLDIQVHFRRNP